MNAKKGFLLSLVYVLSMSVAYTIAGVLAGLFGSNIQGMFQNPFVVVGFSLIFILLGLSMFGFYEISMPKVYRRNSPKKETTHSLIQRVFLVPLSWDFSLL